MAGDDIISEEELEQFKDCFDSAVRKLNNACKTNSITILDQAESRAILLSLRLMSEGGMDHE